MQTNSLAASDVPMVHAGYMGWRAPLLRQGVALYELRPGRAGTERELLGSSGASLHTKAFVVDSRIGFVGSFNFDPRSITLNTEMGILFEDPELAGEVAGNFAQLTTSSASWRLGRRKGRLIWYEGTGDHAPMHKSEPEAGIWRRLVARIVKWLPIESQL